MPENGQQESAPSVYNIANVLTVVRLVLIPIFVWFLAMSEFAGPWWRTAAAVVFLLASVTDFVDGWVARRRGLVTAFGKIADPIADKALVGAALIMLSLWDQLPWWVTGVILFRELGVTVLRFWVIRLGVIAASHGGKIKTVLQLAAIAWYVWPWQGVMADVGPWIMGAATIATVVTGLDYLVRVIVMRRKSRESR
ncbi:MAG TPA: CDP-diacylglycerol--glycerol-3-phosphate 3-phosphatidyltransferase [Candidatus Stackebrandtia faecavium]|nr:CDP-diacylglycerol--glycerol-3-phosphate 3-phosphatidyltransferase [Candidatus Stackebrandtia faecavium]